VIVEAGRTTGRRVEVAMGLRDRRQERRDERRGGAGSGPEVFRMRAKLVDIGDDYWIETSEGRRAYKVDGKVLRVRDTFTIRDAGGQVVATMQERVARVRDTMKIDRPGKPSATVKKAMITPLRDRYVIEADDVGEISVQGNIVDHEYSFEQGGRKIAEVSKRWLRVRDTFGVQVEPDADEVLVLVATAAIDSMT
jgi:uncharacterized protein YxjI